jgi:hypothetical protein
MVKAYKELVGSEALAEALVELVAAGYVQLMGNAGSPLSSPMERPPSASTGRCEEEGSDEQSGTDRRRER